MGWKTNMVAATKGKKELEAKTEKLKHFSVEYVPIESITPNKYNPNRQSEHEYSLLLRSMKDDGFTTPILVQRDTKEIVDGEHRWRAARELGYETIPVVFVHMTAEQMRVATLRHNRARGEEDIELTAELLRELESIGALDWAQKSLQMDEVEMQRLMTDVSAPEILAEEEYSKPWAYMEGTESKDHTDQISVSIEASDRLRVMERKIKKAKTEEEREQARKDHKVYRINLVFTQDEAKYVREVLGNNPAGKILHYCKTEYDKTQQKLKPSPD